MTHAVNFKETQRRIVKTTCRFFVRVNGDKEWVFISVTSWSCSIPKASRIKKKAIIKEKAFCLLTSLSFSITHGLNWRLSHLYLFFFYRRKYLLFSFSHISTTFVKWVATFVKRVTNLSTFGIKMWFWQNGFFKFVICNFVVAVFSLGFRPSGNRHESPPPQKLSTSKVHELCDLWMPLIHHLLIKKPIEIADRNCDFYFHCLLGSSSCKTENMQ